MTGFNLHVSRLNNFSYKKQDLESETETITISMNGDVRVETREKRAKIIPPQGFDSHGSRATQNYYHCNTMLQANDTFEASYYIKLVNNNKNKKKGTNEIKPLEIHWLYCISTVFIHIYHANSIQNHLRHLNFLNENKNINRTKTAKTNSKSRQIFVVNHTSIHKIIHNSNKQTKMK